MKPGDLARSVPLGPHPPKDVRTYIGIALGYLGDQFYLSTTEDGRRMMDITDVRVWLRECGEAFNLSESEAWRNSTAGTEAGAPRKLRLDGSTGSRFEETCNRCGHVHQGRVCGMQMGGGPECRCELEGVPA